MTITVYNKYVSPLQRRYTIPLSVFYLTKSNGTVIPAVNCENTKVSAYKEILRPVPPRVNTFSRNSNRIPAEFRSSPQLDDIKPRFLPRTMFSTKDLSFLVGNFTHA